MRNIIHTIKKIFFYACCTLFFAAPMAKADYSSTVTREYGGSMSIARATALVQTEAQIRSHALLLRKLAREPVMQQIKTVTPVFSPPDINGLICSLYDFPFDHMVNPMTKTITGSVKPVARLGDLRQAVLQALPKRSRLEHYGSVLNCQKSTLHALNRHLGRHLDHQLDQLPDQSGPDQSGPDGQSLPESAAKAADTLIVLLRYQALLRDYDNDWPYPEAMYTQLKELEALDADNALIQGALAEVLLQLEKPQQAQVHSDRALASCQEYAYLHDTQGQILLRLNLPALATDAFTNALALDMHNPHLYAQRGTSHLMRNKIPSMCQDFNKACVLGDCSGSEWAHEHGLCLQEVPPGNTSAPADRDGTSRPQRTDMQTEIQRDTTPHTTGAKHKTGTVQREDHEATQ